MDPRTVFIVVSLLMLLNGGVLGLMRNSFAEADKPAASDWRIATLLLVGASALSSAQDLGSTALIRGLVVVAANVSYTFGAMLLLRAVLRFTHRPVIPWLYALPIVEIGFNFWFAIVTPNFDIRVVVASLFGIVICAAVAYVLLKHRAREKVQGLVVLAITFIALGLSQVVRAYVFLRSASGAGSMLEAAAGINALTALMIGMVPIIGTTAFLLMCLDRVRSDLEAAATTDYLTGLPNRRNITNLLQLKFDEAKRKHQDFALAVIDIDHFKTINDRYGHDAGDLALKHAAQVLRQACRSDELLGRQGGEEFIVILEGAAKGAAAKAAERLRRALASAPMPLPNKAEGEIGMTISIGLSVRDEADQHYDDLLKRADRCLYKAKTSGRNQFAI